MSRMSEEPYNSDSEVVRRRLEAYEHCKCDSGYSAGERALAVYKLREKYVDRYGEESCYRQDPSEWRKQLISDLKSCLPKGHSLFTVIAGLIDHSYADNECKGCKHQHTTSANFCLTCVRAGKDWYEPEETSELPAPALGRCENCANWVKSDNSCWMYGKNMVNTVTCGYWRKRNDWQ